MSHSRTGRRGRLLRGLLVALTAVVVLAGCVSLPRSGPVQASDPELPASQGIGLFARGPETGAEPEEIVEGFLTAVQAGYSDDFLVAREFLAGSAVQTWQPLEHVRIYSDSETPRFSRSPEGAVQLSVGSIASVDAEGRYSESAPDTAIETEFTLARDPEGEWRIIELDDGVVLPAATFSSVYVSSALYFLTPDLEAFVPDARWYPQQTLATSLVRGLLQGPSPWLAPGVVTMVPAGTRMMVEAVTVADNVAQVDLSAEAVSAEPDERALLYAQLERTLRGVSGVQDLEITAAGAPYEVPEDVPALQSYPYTATNTVVVSGGGLADVVGGNLVPRAGSEQLAGMDPRHPAVGYEAGAATVLLAGTDRLITAPTAESQPFQLYSGANLVPPSVDRHGWVWTTPAASDGRLVAVRTDGTQVAVEAPWLAGGTVRSLRISREGARAVVVWEEAGSVVVDTAVVVRETDGTPNGLAEPVRFAERLDDATQLAWVDEQTVAVLGTSEGDAAATVHLVPLGGPSSQLPAVEGTVTLTAGRGERSILLGTAAGRVHERNAASWRPVLSDAYYPALPG